MIMFKKNMIFILFLLTIIFNVNMVQAGEEIEPYYGALEEELVLDAKTSVLPSKFTLGNVDGKNYLTTIKDQGSSVICWSFAGTSSLESNLKYINKVNKTFSAYHPSAALSYNFTDVNNEYGSMKFNKGGNFYNLITYWTSGLGPHDWSYRTQSSLSNTLNMDRDYTVEQTFTLPSFNNYTSTSGARKQFVDKVKNLIMKYGAVYFQAAAPDIYGNSIVYYNSTYNSVFTDSAVMYQNNPHAMVIVGWDDNFSKEKFNKGSHGSKPTQNGAWIVQNSWGPYLGDNGYYYYSYEDYVLGHFISGVSKVDVVDYNNIYQYNSTGKLTMSNYKYGAINFNKGSADELLTQVAFYAVNPGMRFNIYLNPTDNNLTSNSLTKINTNPIEVEYSGFYTYELPTPITLTTTKFSIILESIDNSSFTYNIPLQAYNEDKKFGKELSGILPNQSFTSSDRKTWVDQSKNSNSVFIKAYTENINTQSSVIDPVIYQNKLKSKETLIVKTFTKNMANGAPLTYKIKDSSGKVVTSSFTINKNNLINNQTTAIISGNNIKDDVYLLEITSNNVVGKVNFVVGNISSTLSVATEKITVGLNQTRDIKYLINNPSGMVLTYKTEDKEIATITDGVLKGVNCGTTSIIINNTYKIKVTVEEPIYINQLTDFEIIKNNLNGYYILNTDLDFNNKLFLPLGNNTTPFTGIFIGNGHTISGLSISRDKEYTGIFGYTNGAYITDFNVVSSSIVGVDYTGIIGRGYATDISRITSYDNVIDGEKYVGGIVGFCNYCMVTKSINVSNIFGESYTGGITGYLANSKISESYNKNKISSTVYVGCVTGYLNASQVLLSYNEGIVDGNNNIGGIVGYAINFKIENTYNNAKVAGINAGGLIGMVENSDYQSTLNKSYNAGDVTGNTYGGLIGNISTGNYTITNNYSFSSNDLMGTSYNAYTNTAKKDKSLISNQSAYSNFDFQSYWYIDGSAKLKSLKEATSITLSKNSYVINVGETLELNASVSPTNVLNKIVSYSTNSSFITLNNNVVKGNYIGNANVTVSTTNNIKKDIEIKVISAIKNNAYALKNNIILGLNDETSVSTFAQSLNNNTTYSVHNSKGEIKNGSLIGTNSTINITKDGLSTSYKAVVSGDVNGDGYVNVADLVKINRYIVGLTNIDNQTELYAADVTADNKIQVNDLVKVNRYILNLINDL